MTWKREKSSVRSACVCIVPNSMLISDERLSRESKIPHSSASTIFLLLSLQISLSLSYRQFFPTNFTQLSLIYSTDDDRRKKKSNAIGTRLASFAFVCNQSPYLCTADPLRGFEGARIIISESWRLLVENCTTQRRMTEESWPIFRPKVSRFEFLASTNSFSLYSLSLLYSRTQSP